MTSKKDIQYQLSNSIQENRYAHIDSINQVVNQSHITLDHLTSNNDQQINILKKDIELIKKEKDQLIEKIKILENQNQIEKKQNDMLLLSLSNILDSYLQKINLEFANHLSIDLNHAILYLDQLYEMLNNHISKQIHIKSLSNLLFDLTCIHKTLSNNISLSNDTSSNSSKNILKPIHIENIISFAVEMQSVDFHLASFDLTRDKLCNKCFNLLREIWFSGIDTTLVSDLFQKFLNSLGLQLIIPEISSSFDIRYQKIYKRETSHHSLIKQQIIQVITPGIWDMQTKQVIEKSNVVICE